MALDISMSIPQISVSHYRRTNRLMNALISHRQRKHLLIKNTELGFSVKGITFGLNRMSVLPLNYKRTLQAGTTT